MLDIDNLLAYSVTPLGRTHGPSGALPQPHTDRNSTMFFDSTRSIGNRSFPEGLPRPEAFRRGLTEGEFENDYIYEPDPQHTDCLYVSVRRPLGSWFGLEAPHQILGGDRTTSVVGTSSPLSRDVLNSYELAPLDPRTRAATVIKDWGMDGPLASIKGDRRDPGIVYFLTPFEERGPVLVLASYEQSGPIQSIGYDASTPAWESSPAIFAVRNLLHGERTMMRSNDARYILKGWHGKDESELLGELSVTVRSGVPVDA